MNIDLADNPIAEDVITFAGWEFSNLPSQQPIQETAVGGGSLSSIVIGGSIGPDN